MSPKSLRCISIKGYCQKEFFGSCFLFKLSNQTLRLKFQVCNRSEQLLRVAVALQRVPDELQLLLEHVAVQAVVVRAPD